ncbi:MAG: flavodoxin family protein [Atopobiaceae bacterium]|nr:flavodoxin family protein [Atopobiaceae bacterium]
MTKVLGISFGTKNGNNDCVCKEVLKGAEETGCEVEFIRAQDLDIKHCTGCIACVKSHMSGRGNRCIHKDDFDWLAWKMFTADGIIMVDPIFETGASGLFHTIMDRFGPRMDTGNNFIGMQIAKGALENGGKGTIPPECVFHTGIPVSYIAIGGSDWGTHAQSDHAIQSMTPAWKVIDNEWVAWSKTALMKDEVIARAHQIGINLGEAAKDPEHAEYKGKKGVCPHCDCNDFYIYPGENRAVCAVCGLQGRLSVDEDGVHITYAEHDLCDENGNVILDKDGAPAFPGLYDEKGRERAHDSIEGKQIHGEDIGRNEGILAEMQKTPEYKARVEGYKEYLTPIMPSPEERYATFQELGTRA